MSSDHLAEQVQCHMNKVNRWDWMALGGQCARCPDCSAAEFSSQRLHLGSAGGTETHTATMMMAESRFGLFQELSGGVCFFSRLVLLKAIWASQGV